MEAKTKFSSVEKYITEFYLGQTLGRRGRGGGGTRKEEVYLSNSSGDP